MFHDSLVRRNKREDNQTYNDFKIYMRSEYSEIGKVGGFKQLTKQLINLQTHLNSLIIVNIGDKNSNQTWLTQGQDSPIEDTTGHAVAVLIGGGGGCPKRLKGTKMMLLSIIEKGTKMMLLSTIEWEAATKIAFEG